jgi:hypothetical protein
MKRLYIQTLRNVFLFGICLFGGLLLPETTFASEITPEKVIELVNADRSVRGLASVQVDDALMRAARAKAEDMMRREYFAHTSPDGLTPWYFIGQSGYAYRFAGENLAIHFDDAEEEERAWMESVKHRENILNPKYAHIGVAVARSMSNGQSTTMVVQMFGLPLGAIVPAQSLGGVSGGMIESSETQSIAPSVPIVSNRHRANGFMTQLIEGVAIVASVLIGIPFGTAIWYRIRHSRSLKSDEAFSHPVTPHDCVRASFLFL